MRKGTEKSQTVNITITLALGPVNLTFDIPISWKH